MAAPAPAVDVGAGISLFRDTCNVYVLRSGREAVAIDFGAGRVLDHLAELDVDRITFALLSGGRMGRLHQLATEILRAVSPSRA